MTLSAKQVTFRKLLLPVAAGCFRSYPHIGHRSRRVEELADDVSGGGDTEDDGPKNLLPPGQQQHGVLSPATVSARLVWLYQADGALAFLPVTLAEGEVIAVVYSKKRQRSVSGVKIHYVRVSFCLESCD